MTESRPVRRKFLFCFTSLLLASMHSPAAWAAATCQAEDVAAAARAGDNVALTRLYKARGCEGDKSFCTSRLLGVGFLAESDRLKAGGRSDEASRVFAQAESYRNVWQITVRLGDLAFSRATGGDRNAYAEAAADYEEAINDIADKLDCRSFGEAEPPSVETIASIHKRMTEAKLLAPTFVIASTRDGECGGVFLPSVREFKPKATQLPIEFETDSTTLTAKGEKAAEGLTQCVTKMKSISLSGHADAHGSDGYNMALSARRLEAIKARLVQSGYDGGIILEPKGKREPFAVDDPGSYSSDQIDQMNRRVELRGVKR